MIGRAICGAPSGSRWRRTSPSCTRRRRRPRTIALGSATHNPSGARWSAIKRHADLLALKPVEARPDHLQALAHAGLGATAIVTLSQVIAFVSFQVRVQAGLQLLGAAPEFAAGRGARPTRVARAGRAPGAPPTRLPADLPRPTQFTIAMLNWTPWLEPLSSAEERPEHGAALEGDRGKSPYFRLLARDVGVLIGTDGDRSRHLLHAGGVPRHERELSAAATSRLNGCIYCTSVHARLAAQLSKRSAEIDRLLALGVAPGTDLGFEPRWQAVTDLAVALAPTPPVATTAHVDRLREVGFGELEILDVIQAAAFFAWANRSMLTLGEPYL